MAVTISPGIGLNTISGSFDLECTQEILRPAVVKEDVKLMQDRSRVSMILRSQNFRKNLEKIVASQMKSGYLNANIVALKKILDYLTPHKKFGYSNFTKGATIPIVPINDLRNAQSIMYSKAERLFRCKLASIYRLVEMFGWNRGIANHITARICRDKDTHEYLMNPLGLLYHELTASTLVKINLEGDVLDAGTAGLGVDKYGWMLHASVHLARPDIRCIIHLNTPATVAVSCTKTGLLPVSQEAMILGEALVYDPTSTCHIGVTNGDDTTTSGAGHRAAINELLSSRGDDCTVLFIRNHGLLAMGQSIEEAWFVAFNAVLACEAQLRLSSISEDELVLPTVEAQQAAHYVGRTPSATQLHPGEVTGSAGWRWGELEFEALMRRLDAAGYCTGHVYRLSQIHQTSTVASTMHRQTLESTPGVPTSSLTPREAAAYVRQTASLGRGFRGLKDVEIPPTASSFSTAYYQDEESRLAAAAEAKSKTLSLSRKHWLNTPNSYVREDIEEVGTTNPKKIPHWTEGNDLTLPRGLAMQIDNPNQFAPQGIDPNEFKQQRQRVKERYYKDVKTAGPVSRVLEGLGLDDDKEVVDSSGVSPDATSPRGTLLRYDPSNPPSVEPGHVVIVGAASKGIINRDQRHNAGVYQSIYSPNPFDRITDEELIRYRENIDRKAKGLPSLEEEEAATRLEEARQAAVVARQAMEAAAHDPKYRLTSELTVDNSQLTPTSGAEASHDEIERDPIKDADKKKKKRRFKMPSFARKSKGKIK